MANILKTWDTLINTSLNPISNIMDLVTDESIQTYINQSEAEGEKVKTLLLEGIIDRHKIRDKQQYVQINQALLIRLLDKLHFYRQAEKLGHKTLHLYNIVSGHLEDVLNFIEDFFSKYFDRNERVPAAYLFILIEELFKRLEQLHEIMNAEIIDPALTNILANNFNAFCSLKSARPTYKEVAYQKDLMNELLSGKTLKSELSIKEVLFYFNFNDDDYVTYLVEKFQAVIKPLDSIKEKIAALRFEQKTINQIRTQLNCYLSDKMPPLKQQINSWIEEEIKFLEANTLLQNPIQIKAQNETEDKIQTSLSVSKLSLLIKLMVIDKIIINRVVAQVLRIVIKTVTTLHAENIAYGSIETKYHHPDKGTISAVKEMLFRWINILNKL